MSNNQLKTIFNQEVITDLAQRIKKVFPSFNNISFEQDANQNLDSLELKQRSIQICTALTSYLPSEFEKAASILIEAQKSDARRALAGPSRRPSQTDQCAESCPHRRTLSDRKSVV